MDPKSSTIHIAALNSDFSTVESLLHSDPKLATSVDVDTRTPLHWTCVSGSTEIFKLLLSLPNDKTLEPGFLAQLDKDDGFGNYHININQQDEGGWVSLQARVETG